MQEEQPHEAAPEQTGEASGHAKESALDRLWHFARAHPVLSILGVAGIGLFGGIELAGGVLIGAGVAAALRGRPEVQHAEEAARTVRHRARSFLARAPHEVRERARAVVDAARKAAASDGHAGHDEPTASDIEDETPGARSG